MSYSIEVHSALSATLSVVHTCGHTTKYGYSGEKYAKADAKKKEAQICSTCHNLKMLGKSTNAKLNK